MDRKANMPANIFAYTNGIIMTLILGVGMCFSMKVIGNDSTFVLGIILGVIGIAGVVGNYFGYKKILEKSKSKYSSDIIRLANEISKEED